MRSRPSVAVVIVNFDGRDFLGPCLESVAAQDYAGPLEVIVVDNGSTDGSVEYLRATHPSVRVLPQDRNLGFAPAVNVGVASTEAELVVFLNNDAAAEPDFVTSLVDAVDPGAGVPCVGARILSWEGDEVLFDGGRLTFYGMAAQEGGAAADGEPILFACGGAMLIDRQTYVGAGGFDDAFFAYFEDVDLGWRLWVLGHEVRLAARATCRHHHHGTSRRFPVHEKHLLDERNALRMVIKNYDRPTLDRVLGPALLLGAHRAVRRGMTGREAYDIGAHQGDTEEVPRLSAAFLYAVADIVEDLPQLLAARDAIQSRRRRSDADISPLFRAPFSHVLMEERSVAAQDAVVSGFGLDPLVGAGAGGGIGRIVSRLRRRLERR